MPQPCPGLAALIEQNDLADPRVADAIETFCAPLRRAGVDTVVLGCTHYAFVEPMIQRAMGRQVHIIDTAHAVSRHVARIAASVPALPDPSARGITRLQTTADLAVFQGVTARLWP